MSALELLIAAFITALVLCGVLFYKLFKLKLALNLAQNDRQNLSLNLESLKEAVSKNEFELKENKALNLRLNGENSKLLALYNEKQNALESLKIEKQTQKEELENKLSRELKAQKESLKAEYEMALINAQTQSKESLKALEERYKQSLEELKKEFTSNLKRQNEAFLNQNQLLLNDEGKKLLNSVFEPVKKSLEEYHLKLAKNEIEIQTNIKNMFEYSQKIGEKADKLSQILKGDKKLRGNFAELQLKNVLENSGLQEGFHYKLQEHFKREGKSFYPDAVVQLSKDKSIIIDAKFSLPSSFESLNSAFEEQNESGQGFSEVLNENAKKVSSQSTKSVQKAMSQSFVAHELAINLKARIDELAKKPYKSFASYDFILLFIPYQNILDLALSHEPTLYQQAYNKGIFLTTPHTLFMALKTIDLTWQHIQSNENINLAFQKLGSFYDKFAGVMEDFTKMKQNFERLQDNFSSLENKFSSGKGNLMSKFNELKERGAKTAKSLNLDFAKD